MGEIQSVDFKGQSGMRKNIMNKTFRLAGVFLLVIGFNNSLTASEGPGRAAIASAHYLATEAGHEILEKGGNAFDAAVAVSAALAVVEPTSSGLGGGAFWLLHRASDNFEVMIDSREQAPAAAYKDMYLGRRWPG